MCSYYSTKACMPSEQETLPSKKVTPSKFDQVYSAINQSYAKIYTTLNEKFSPKKNEDNIKDEDNLDTSDCSDDLIPQYDLKDLEIGPYYLQREADQLRSQLSVKEAKHLSKWENKWDQIMSLGSGRPLEEELDESGLYSEEDMSLRQYARLHSKSFPKLLEFGAPMQYRWNVWKYMLKPHRFFEDGLYEKLKGHISASESQIKKDLHRTFPEEKYFTSSKYGRIGQEQLHNVLRAIAAYFPNTGYVQGMNFLAGLMLLLSGGNELQSFWMFVALARDPKFLFMGLFEREFPLLNFYIFTFHGVLEAKLPNLYHHIQKHQLPIDMWLMKWFLTIFVPTLPSKDVVRIWDFILRQGFLGMIKIAVGIMKFYEKELLRQDACGMNMMFQSIMEDHLQKEYQESNILNTINPIINMIFGRNKEKNSSPGVRSNNMRCSFREFEVEEVLDHASEISLELEHMKEIIAIYEVETGNRLPEPYRKIMASLANPHNSSRRFKEFQNDLDYYMMRSGLHEAGNQGFKFDSFLGQNEANGERTA